ncbi:polysaccharide biosynthesis tyrosine autokinase [Actinoplanes sp. NEAU-A12]|uniref:Polysaccharide biosynthesis tyrosine autokinase n=1 Tax=Actinoplanes sandaracinus TaxID=3045177 RepID=A0ABT6WC27_9ACTN|nr:polysaccharide biosynthesis tyrosine autokinase [Actinoplanes sandaracinus]MDI6097294.1 polysaccharide biosynthesis tyrosine autokinase [Actinoplanes sandaracinus]
MELRAYVRACRRRWLWLVVPVLVATVVAAGLTLAGAPGHKSSMVLFVSSGTGDPDAGARRLNSYIALLTGPRVAQAVVDRMGPDITGEEVRKSLSAQMREGTDLLEISATDPSAERSRQIVTTAASVLVGLARQIGAPADPDDGPPPAVSIVQDAVTVAEPDNLARNTGFAAVLGLLLGAAAVAVKEATGRTVGEEDDLRRLGLEAVGAISIGGRSRSGHPDQALAEAFRRLRSLLPVLGEPQAAARSGRGRSVLLTGASRKEGTTAVTCGLAIAMAETGARVVLVDANMRTPGIGRYLSLDTSPGLAEVLAGTARVPDVLQDSLGGRVTVLPAGEHAPDPGELLASPRLGATVRTLTERYDIVLVDSPALNGVADAAVLGQVTDSALLVVRAGRTRAADVEKSIDLLQRVGAKLAGAVLNALPRKLPANGSWHGPAEMSTGVDSPDLIFGLAPDQPTARMDDTFVSLPVVGPARGRARVIAPDIEAHDPGEPAGAEKAEDKVPAQRSGEDEDVAETAPAGTDEEQRRGE